VHHLDAILLRHLEIKQHELDRPQLSFVLTKRYDFLNYNPCFVNYSLSVYAIQAFFGDADLRHLILEHFQVYKLIISSYDPCEII
jgi:hypothetical protein